jgi:hypothetical protein
MYVRRLCRVAPPVAWRRPHGPVRAQLRHTVLQTAAALRRRPLVRHSRPHPRGRGITSTLPSLSLALTCTPFLISMYQRGCRARGPPPDCLLPYSQALPGGLRLLSLSTMRQLRLPGASRPLPLSIGGRYLGPIPRFAPTRREIVGG